MKVKTTVHHHAPTCYCGNCRDAKGTQYPTMMTTFIPTEFAVVTLANGEEHRYGLELGRLEVRETKGEWKGLELWAYTDFGKDRYPLEDVRSIEYREVE